MMNIKPLLTVMMISLLGCHSPSQENSTGKEHKPYPLVAEEKLDSSTLTAPKDSLPYKNFEMFKGDTLSYLRNNFIVRKEYYQYKPLSDLLKDLEIPILKYTIIAHPHFSIHDKLKGIYLKFERDADILNKYDLKKVPDMLIITFKDSVDIKTIRPMLRRGKSLWTKESETYFSRKHVGNISMTHYSDTRNEGTTKNMKKY